MSDDTKRNQKEKVLKKWDELINELDIYLQEARKAGGTKGHKVGSMRDQQMRVKNSFFGYL